MVETLDLRGLKCPLTVLQVDKALGRSASGAELEVLCTDPVAAIDVPHLVRTQGHALLAQTRDGQVLTFRIRKV